MEDKVAVIDLNDVENVVVAGDIHGDFNTLKKIKKFCNSSNKIIFLGDYVDRGENNIEVVECMKDLINSYPENVIPLKGNHEDYTEGGRPKALPNTLMTDVGMERWPSYFYDFKEDFLDKLYLSAIIPDKILFVHGGISEKIKNVESLRYPDSSIEEDILWSDPTVLDGEYPNPRGAGVLFGPDISDNVAKRLNVRYIIRSHEPRKASKCPCTEHEGRIITTNSSLIYGSNPFVLKIPANSIPDTFDKNSAIHLYPPKQISLTYF